MVIAGRHGWLGMRWGRSALAAGIAAICCLAAAPGAQAASPGISLALDVPASVGVGQKNVAANLLVTATGDTPLFPLSGSDYIGICNSPTDSTGCGLLGTPYDQGILLTPSCAQTSGPTTTAPICQVPDAGVFAISPTAIGSGSGCQGTTFDVSVVDTALGTVKFAPLPAGSRVLLGASGSSCRISFTFDVLKSPADADAGTAGVQTRSLASAGAEYNTAASAKVYKPAPLKAVAGSETTINPPCVPGQPECTTPPTPPCVPGQPECPTPPTPPCVPGQPQCPTPPTPPCVPGQPECPPPPSQCVPGKPPPTGVICPSSIVSVRMAGTPHCAAGSSPIKKVALGKPADTAFDVTVFATQARTAVKRVEFFFNNRKVKTLTKTNRGINRYVLRVDPRKLRKGSYRITARVSLVSTGAFTFRQGAPDYVRRITSPNIRVVPLATCRPPTTTG